MPKTLVADDAVAVDDTASNMILRTVFLPVELDRKLKTAAEHEAKSKGEIVRLALKSYLTNDSGKTKTKK